MFDLKERIFARPPVAFQGQPTNFVGCVLPAWRNLQEKGYGFRPLAARRVWGIRLSD
jgi:hypothetical protein